MLILVVLLSLVCVALIVCLIWPGSPAPAAVPLRRFEVRLQHHEQLIKQLEVQLLAAVRRTEEAYQAGFRAFPAADCQVDWDNPSLRARAKSGWKAFCARGWPSC